MQLDATTLAAMVGIGVTILGGVTLAVRTVDRAKATERRLAEHVGSTTASLARLDQSVARLGKRLGELETREQVKRERRLSAVAGVPTRIADDGSDEP